MWLNCELNHSLLFHDTCFLLERTTDEHHAFSDLGILQMFSQKWIKRACHFRESNWRYLLPAIKFEPSEKQKFGKLYLPFWTSRLLIRCPGGELRRYWWLWIRDTVQWNVSMFGKPAGVCEAVVSQWTIKMLGNLAWVRDPFKVGDRPVDFNGAEENSSAAQFRIWRCSHA